MMISHRDSKRSYIRYIIWIVLIAIFFYLWPFVQRATIGLFEITHMQEFQMFHYFQNKYNAVSMYMKSNEALYVELRNTQDELRKEQQKYTRLQMLEDSVATYERFATSSNRVVFARRIGVIDSFVTGSFRINIGLDSLCKIDDVVVSPQNVFLGTIAKIDARTSNVKSSLTGEEIKVRVNTDGTQLIVRGNTNGTYTTRVPRTVTLALGAVLVLDSNPEVIIGSVIDIDTNDAESFIVVTVGTGFSQDSIDRVAVLCTI